MDQGISTTELSTLDQCEQVIERGMQTFVDVGRALLAIREQRLYRQHSGTFEEYCRERWGFSDNYARRIIGAAEVTGNLETVPIGTLPTTENQARPLSKLPPEEQSEAWQEAVDTAPKGDDGQPKVTAKHVQAVVNRRTGEVIEDAEVITTSTQRIEDRPIPPDAPPLDLDVSNEPSVKWMKSIERIQTCISCLPDLDTLDDLPLEKRRYVVDRFQRFSKQMQEAVHG